MLTQGPQQGAGEWPQRPISQWQGAEASAKLPQGITCCHKYQNFHRAAYMQPGVHVHLHACAHTDTHQRSMPTTQQPFPLSLYRKLCSREFGNFSALIPR